MNRRIMFWVMLIGLVALDQGVKAWSRGAADLTSNRTFLTLWPGVFELRLTFNQGIAFGWFQGGERPLGDGVGVTLFARCRSPGTRTRRRSA